MNTVYGPVLDQLGHGKQTTLRQGADGPMLNTRAWGLPADQVRRVQADTIPVDISHDHRPVGEVVHLELREKLWAVAHVDADVQPPAWMGDLYWSASWTANEDGSDITVEWLSLTTHPRQLGLEPVTFLPGELSYRGCQTNWHGLDSYDSGLLERASHSRYHRRRGRGPIVVADHSPEREAILRRRHMTENEMAWAMADDADRRPPGVPIRHSSPVRNAVIRVR